MLSVALPAQRIVLDKIKSKEWSDIASLQQLIQNLTPSKRQRLGSYFLSSLTLIISGVLKYWKL